MIVLEDVWKIGSSDLLMNQYCLFDFELLFGGYENNAADTERLAWNFK